MNHRNLYSALLTAISLVLLLSLPAGGGLAAAELVKLEVGHEGGVYTVRLEMELDASADHVEQVLTNYRQLHRLNPSIVESRILFFRDDGIARVFTRMESCVLFFCSGFTRVEDIYQAETGDLLAVIVPGQSDFKTGTARWQITKLGERTRLLYEASMQPDFYIPPVVGSYFVKKKFKDELLVSFNRIECCAGSQARMNGRVTGDGPGSTRLAGGSC